LYYNLQKISGENGIILVFISTIFSAPQGCFTQWEKRLDKCIASNGEVFKGIKCFCLKSKYIFFFKENPVFLGQQEHFRAFMPAGDI
jgi:hypothetical protein